MRIAVVGASGFVGTEVTRLLENLGHTVIQVQAPRLGPVATSSIQESAAAITPTTAQLNEIQDCEVLINAAGNPDASDRSEASLNGPNALLVALLAKLCISAGVPRFVHISSAVVQGDSDTLDSTRNVIGFSPYARSKIMGEELALEYGPAQSIVYRPPSVHHESRRVTQQLHKIANSRLSTVAYPGDRRTPQALLASVGEAIAVLATSESTPPQIVHHPWEGLTTGQLLQLLGHGRKPTHVPRLVAVSCVKLGKIASRILPPIAPYIRRIELVWMGQDQAKSWLPSPSTTVADWEDLAARVKSQLKDIEN